MPRQRLRRYSYRRTSRPRKWSPYLVTGAPVASHSPPKSGGHVSVRQRIEQMRIEEAALTVNEDLSSS